MISKRLKKFFHLDFGKQLLFLEAVFFLSFSKLVIRIVPLRKAAPHFGNLNAIPRVCITDVERRISETIQKSIYMASTILPWKSVCLDKALAGLIMLNRRKIPNSLCLGVRKAEHVGGLEAHAWIVCGEQILLGGKRSLHFIKVASFSKTFESE